ncbi:multidrug effflux MFS transporter [Barnesiella viscericola]|uniref:Multidrug effflux MFS transporter n=1 Tax=Barnesiella viscericola TaxID=397865 RepID=A0A921MSE3_9BACT|nr:multidrug effflux MFS transporter [Barnesiella viscericola]HJG89730.1 multidrug effflux MFS transporter [Barnesiella viscericola]
MKGKNSALFLFILLGALTAFGPFVTDMYLPSLPSMVGYFDTQASMVQLGLTSSMIGLALGQLFFGPLSDRYGRRSPLLAAMLLFIVSTVCCIFSSTIESFIFFRLIQGVAGAGGIVVSRSIATDLFTGRELAKAMAIIGAINGVAPVASPVLGGFLTDSIGWKGIFVVLLGIGVLLLLGNLRFRESLPIERRKRGSLKSMLAGFGVVLRNRRYVYYVLQMGFAMGVLFTNISSSPFIMQQHYGFSAFGFSLFFGINALAIGLAAGLSVKFSNPEHAMFVGSAGMTLLSLIEFVALSLGCSFVVYEALLFLLLFALGLTFTASTTLAMDCERANSGTASAMFGAAGFAFGGVVSPLVGLGNILTTTGLLFLVCSLCSLGFTLLALSQTHASLWHSFKGRLLPMVRIVRRMK